MQLCIDAQYDAVHTKEDLKQVLQQAKSKNIRIIEVFTNREENTETHRTLWTAISKELDVVWKVKFKYSIGSIHILEE